MLRDIHTGAVLGEVDIRPGPGPACSTTARLGHALLSLLTLRCGHVPHMAMLVHPPAHAVQPELVVLCVNRLLEGMRREPSGIGVLHLTHVRIGAVQECSPRRQVGHVAVDGREMILCRSGKELEQ